MRVGFGYDLHRLVSGRPLVLGGVAIDFGLGLDGHSDADVLVHAICDALLGAVAMGDIGGHFPPGDSRFAGISSLKLLQRVGSILSESGWEVVNLDSVIIAEAPKMAPYTAEMREKISAALGISAGQVSVKATTTERLGVCGRGEGIAAQAVALVTNDNNWSV